MEITPRERMKMVINHERPDRTPAVLRARPEVNRALIEYFGVKDIYEVHKILGTDGWGGVHLDISFPESERKANTILEGDFPYAGSKVILHDKDIFEDCWGIIRKIGKDRKYVQWVSGPLVNARDPDEYNFPGPESIIEDEKLPRKVEEQKKSGLWVSGSITQPFTLAWELRGIENLLIDYAINHDFLEKLYDKIYLLYGEMAKKLTSAGIDQLRIVGDIAMQDRLFMRPEWWRKIDKVRLAKLISECKEINPELHIFLHSDGNLWEIMDDLIEIGFEIIDPIQPECMDPVEVKKRYGDKIVLHGCGSLQKTLPFGTPEDCREEVRYLIRNCGYNGGLVLRISNAIGFDVPIENVVAWYEEVRNFNLSKL